MRSTAVRGTTPLLTGSPARPVTVPAELALRYRGRWSLAWQIVPGVATFRVDRPGRTLFVKVATAERYPTLPGEAARLRWARDAGLAVPVVADCGGDGMTDWLVTEALPGLDGTDPSLLGRPELLVPALGAGLRRFHDAAPVLSCPFAFTVEEALGHVRRRVAAGDIDPAGLHPEHAHLVPVTAALRELERLRPAAEDLVVCHGDYCFPNVLLRDGAVSAYLDLGELGVADRSWDVVIGAWSTVWNVGPGWEQAFYDAYGMTPDPRRVAFYRLLYDLSS